MERGLFHRPSVAQLFSEHRAGHRDHADRIWRLLNLELWHRIFIDKDVGVIGGRDTVSGSAHIFIGR